MDSDQQNTFVGQTVETGAFPRIKREIELLDDREIAGDQESAGLPLAQFFTLPEAAFWRGDVSTGRTVFKKALFEDGERQRPFQTAGTGGVAPLRFGRFCFLEFFDGILRFGGLGRFCNTFPSKGSVLPK